MRTMSKNRINYFEYASVDFLIDKNGIPVFMEVNDNTLAPYYINQKSYIAQELLVNNSELINPNLEHEKDFLACFERHLAELPGRPEEKMIAILCKHRDQPAAIAREIHYLIMLFRRHGYNAGMYFPEDCEVRQGYLYIKRNNTKPTLVFRRNFSFPPVGIKQPVINDLRVRKFAENKYDIHKIVDNLINKGDAEIRQPQTYLVKDRSSLILAIHALSQNRGECIAKPNTSYGGDGFYVFSDKEIDQRIREGKKIESIAKRLEEGEEYLIQERIETALFRSENNYEYCFDVRLMIYEGRFAGIEGRRSGVPFIKGEMCKTSLVTNIKCGGVDLLVLSSLDEQYYYSTKSFESLNWAKQVNFEIDNSCLVLGPTLFSKMKKASELIVKAIDETIVAREDLCDS